MTTRCTCAFRDRIALKSSALLAPTAPFLPRLTTVLLTATLSLAASQALAGGQGGAGTQAGGEGGGWINQGNGANTDPNDGRATVSDLSANTVREFTTIIHGGVGGTAPTGGGGGGGAAAYFGGTNATVTVRSNLLGGSGWIGYSPAEGGGGGGDGLIVKDGTVKVAATGQVIGGDATYSMGGSGGGGGTGLYLGTGVVQNDGLIVGGVGGYNDGPAPSGIALGGDGGAGVITRNGRVVNLGRIEGGAGGTSMTPASNAGNGGEGVIITEGSNSHQPPGAGNRLPDLDNQGHIRGGNAVNNLNYPDLYLAGSAGTGVLAENNVYILNRGTIAGGIDGNGEQGPAIALLGNGNRLELTNSSQTIGSVSSFGHNTLALNSPDGKPATATITGNLFLSPTSTYEVRATPSDADRLTVNGKAKLGGTVSVLAGSGTYAASTRYTILSAQSLSGSFASATSNLAFLTPTVANEGNDVVLTLALRQAPKP
ncbi:hypothetical protein KDH83_27575, partial [Achromobacter sp. Marseille-Q0513]|nr:hypothetical protein [Achromobacter sp. Marseille-Q0513]